MNGPARMPGHGICLEERCRMARWIRLGIVFALVFAFAALVGCSSGGGSKEVTSQQYGTFWPVTVEKGTLHCLNSTGRRRGEAVFEHEGTYYALNDTATEAGHADISSIRGTNPEAGGAYTPINNFVTAAEDLCH